MSSMDRYNLIVSSGVILMSSHKRLAEARRAGIPREESYVRGRRSAVYTYLCGHSKLRKEVADWIREERRTQREEQAA